MTDISPAAEAAREAHRNSATGQFGTHTHTAPEVGLGGKSKGTIEHEYAGMVTLPDRNRADSRYAQLNMSRLADNIRKDHPEATQMKLVFDDDSREVMLRQLHDADGAGIDFDESELSAPTSFTPDEMDALGIWPDASMMSMMEEAYTVELADVSPVDHERLQAETHIARSLMGRENAAEVAGLIREAMRHGLTPEDVSRMTEYEMNEVADIMEETAKSVQRFVKASTS